MDSYIAYVLLSTVTILLPGPAVMLTINNSVQRGRYKTFSGVLGIATAILFISGISATSLGVIITQSIFAFTVIKFIGAAYLLYMGLKMWKSNSVPDLKANNTKSSHYKCFSEGFLVSISNPKAIVFFMSVFPQFIDLSKDNTSQLVLLSITFSFLVVIIHSTYSLLSCFAKSKLSSEKSKGILNKVSGSVFVSFAIGLVVSAK
ncbi:LysE family translocator [Vibrio kanaloae]|uniref:LysE family translocator n=1 Tax=Vibrio kanaloae TaxID=170673 RepID=UPI0010BE96EC|nr:LysE family translocator [Vibrio kanaloae]TKF74159.1 LysE family translocator [Vibrio kanaloae]